MQELRDTVESLRRIVEALCQEHRITVTWTNGSAVPGEAQAYANWRARTIVTPRIVTVDDGVTALHEIGHIFRGACPETEPHRRDASVTRWWHCLECERDAWDRACRLYSFSREMYQHLQRSLRSYIRTTPASQAAVAAARTLASDSTYARLVLARCDRERRLEMAAEMARWAAEARRPRLITRQQRQIAQLRAWAREDAQQRSRS